MLDEMTPGDLFGWQRYYIEEPWGEQRADQRAAAQALWNTAPYAGEGANLPNLTYPYWVDETAEFEKTVKAIEERKKAILDGHKHRKAGNSPND